ncbi:MAG: heme ABC transporter permease CcmB [Bryobacterales bacterium]|nr:heme ABC transporter permease CcmB [Bryobacterales bacterium]
MKTFLRAAAAVASKDLRSELRTKEAFNASFAFSMVILVLFSFAFDPSSEELSTISGGLLWLVFSFAGALVLNRSFARELQNDCLDALMSAPVPVAAVFFGKTLANYFLLMIVEIAALAVFAVLYNTHFSAQFWPVVLVMLLGTWGMTVIGTMFSALTVNLRMREMMLPTLVYPLLIPALMAAMTLTSDLMNGTPLGAGNMIWLRVLAGFDFIYTILAMVFIDIVLVG